MSPDVSPDQETHLLSSPQVGTEHGTDKLVILPNMSWRQLESLDAALTGTGARLTYLDGYLEIRTSNQNYEELRSTLALLLETHLQESGRRFYARGGPRLGSPETQGRNEPDESYDLDNPKEIPDLVLEVLTEDLGIDKLEGYRRVQVPEVWIWRQKRLTLYRLRATGYEPVEFSELIPDVDPKELEWYINLNHQQDGITSLAQQVQKPES